MTERLAPTSILNLDNLSGSVSDIQDDPDSPDANWLTVQSTGADTAVRAAMANPSDALDGTQEVRVLLRRDDTTGIACDIELWESGSFVETLATGINPATSGGSVHSATFSPSALSGDGSGVEIRVYGHYTAGGMFGADSHMEVGAIEWNAEVSAGSSDLNASPGSIDFGVVNVGDTGTVEVTITNNGDADLEIGSISVTGDGYSIVEDNASNQTVSAADGDSVTFKVQFQPGSGGSSNGTVTIPSNDPAGDETIPVSGQGLVSAGHGAPATTAYLRFTAGEMFTMDNDTGPTMDNDTDEISVYGLPVSYAVASRADFRDQTWHEPDLVSFPDPETGFPDEFGLPQPARISMAVRERPEEGRTYRQLDAGDQVESVPAFVELVKTIEQEDGELVTFTYPRQMQITSTEMREAGLLGLELIDRLGQSLDQLYPTERYTADTHPDLIPDHEGRIIPYTVASATYPARHVPGTIIAFDETTGETKVSFGRPGGGSLNAVYRGDRNARAVVDASEYTVANEGGEIVATFEAKQKDPRGRWYVFSADVAGDDSNNVADELKRLLELHGMTVGSASHSTLQGLATTWKALVTCDYGNPAAGESGQRQVRGIIRDLLRIARSGVDFNGDGELVFIPDQQQSSSGEYVNGTSGAGPGSRRCRIHPLPRRARRKTITGQFGASPQDPADAAWTIERRVPTGRAPEGDPTRVRYLHHPEGADRLTWYWAMLEEYNREGRIEIWDTQRAVGDVLTLTHDGLWAGTRQVVLRSRRARVLGDEYRVRQYHDDIHTYEAATLPATRGEYTEDWSATPPDAPTDLTLEDSGVIEDGAGNFTAWVRVSFIPPANDNWEIGIVEVSEDASNARLAEQDTTTVTGGRMELRLGGLPTNLADTVIEAYMRNAFGLDGAVASLTTDTATDQGAPGAPQSVTLSQLPVSRALNAVATEPAVGLPNDFSHVKWEYEVNGSGTWNVLEGKRTGNIDFLGEYGDSYRARATLVDRDGNESGTATSNSVTIVKNVGTPDFKAQSVDTDALDIEAVVTNRISDDDVTTEKRELNSSKAFSNGGIATPKHWDTFSTSISESKTPLVMPVSSRLCWLRSVSSSLVEVGVRQHVEIDTDHPSLPSTPVSVTIYWY